MAPERVLIPVDEILLVLLTILGFLRHGNLCGIKPSELRIVEIQPRAAVLKEDVSGIMAPRGRCAMVVNDLGLACGNAGGEPPKSWNLGG